MLKLPLYCRVYEDAESISYEIEQVVQWKSGSPTEGPLIEEKSLWSAVRKK